MTAKTTPTVLSDRVAANVRRLRTMRGWSAQELSDRVTAAGCPISRQVIANRETKRVPSRVSVDELFAFADIFGRPVTDLVAEEVHCERCLGQPPTGFVCGLCGASGSDGQNAERGSE